MDVVGFADGRPQYFRPYIGKALERKDMANITDADHGMEDVGTPCNDKYLHEPTLKEKTAKGLFWGGVSNFVQQIVGMVFSIAIARILSPDDYGLIAMLTIFTAMANALMDSGFTTALVNKKAIEHKDYNAVFWFSVFISIAIYVVLFFAAPLIAKFFHQPTLKDLSRLLFLSFLFAGTGIAHNAFLVKKIMAKQRGMIDMAAVFVSGIVGLVLALKGYAFWGLAIQQISQTLIAVLLRWHFSPWRPTFEFDFTPLKEMFGFSFKMLLTTIVSISAANVFSVVLGRYFSETETGFYQQGYKWASLGTSIITAMVVGISQTVLVEAVDDEERQINIFRKMVRFGAFVSFPAILGLGFVSKEFILITVGERWLNSVIFMQIYCVWGSFNYLWYLYVNLLLSHNKSDIYLLGSIFIWFVQISVVYLSFSYGISTMVSYYVLVYFLGIFLWHYFVNKLIRLRLRDVCKDIFPFLLTTICAIIIAWLITKLFVNVYLCFLVKILIVFSIYTYIMKNTNVVVFKESCDFILKRR